MLRKDWMKFRIQKRVLFPALALAAFAAAVVAQTIPTVVVSSPTTVNSSGVSSPGKVVQDTCGNLYEMEAGGSLIEIPANGGPSMQIGGYFGSTGAGDGLVGALAIDIHNNLYVDNKWSGQATEIPSTNCVPNPGAAFAVLGNGSIGPIDGWWYDPGDIAVDPSGDMFVVSDGFGGSGSIYEQTSSGAGVLVMAGNSIPQVQTIAVDGSGDIFFTTSGSGIVYEIPKASYGTNSPTPVISSGLKTAFGLAFDRQGDLLIGDSATGSIYEVPFTTSLEFGSIYLVASGLPLSNPLSIAQDGKTILYTNGSSSSIYEQLRGGGNFGSVAVGSTAKATLNVAFNAAVQPATISFSTNSAFASATGGTCVAGTSYTAGESCTANASFTPAAPGYAKGALVVADSTGTALATANLYGTGLGAGLTIDPGTVSALGSGLKTPTSVALDNAGDLFIADSGASTVWEIPAGNGAPIAIGSGFNSPKGVALDGAGNVYVADTGNNQIVEVPVVNGALNTAAQAVLVSGNTSIAGSSLNNPSGLTTDLQGNLYIADTGNNRVLFLPQSGGWDVNGAFTLGSGFTAPLATTVTASGLIYVADSGSGKIYSIPFPGPAAPITVVATGLSDPSALGTDAAGDLFVVDKGNNRVSRIPNITGSLASGSATNVSIGIANPYGLAIDTAGNLYVSDDVNSAAYAISRTKPTISFGNVNPGTTSNPAAVLVENAGNQALTLRTPYYAATGNTTAFILASSEANACASGASVATGANCTVEATFAPSGFATYSETLALSSNATNASSPEIVLAGVGVTTEATTTTLAVTSPSGNPYYGEAITLSASVTSSLGTPSGDVALMVDGSQVSTSALKNGVAEFSLGNGLAGGSHMLEAEYLGATTSNFVFASSDSVVDTIVVTPVTTTTVLSFTTNYVNPASQPALTPITLTSSVSSISAGIPTGTVTFTITNSGAAKVTASAPLMAASGGVFQATYSYTPPAPAAGVAFDVATVAASYGGDPNFSGSTSASQSFDIGPTTGSVVVTASGTSLSSGGSTITFSNTSYSGWQGVVNYQCLASSLPANAICVFSPGQVTVLASTSTTPYAVATTQLKVVVNNPPNSPAQGSMLWWVGGMTGLLLFWMRRRVMRGALGTVTALLGVALFGIAASGLTACGGIQYTTPTGTSTVTVIASADPYASGSTNTTQGCGVDSSGVASPALAPCSQQTFKVSLTVQ